MIAAAVLPVVGTMNVVKTQVLGMSTTSGENEGARSKISESYEGMQDEDWFPQGAGNTDPIYHMGNVGIGTNTIDEELTVKGSGWIQAIFRSLDSAGGIELMSHDGAKFELQSTESTHYLAPNSFIIYDRTNGRTCLVIDPHGNVAIGEVDPTSRLQVDGMIHSTTNGFKFPDGSIQTTAATGGGSCLWSQIGSDIYYDSGNVGIGTDDPRAELDVTDPTSNPEIIIRHKEPEANSILSFYEEDTRQAYILCGGSETSGPNALFIFTQIANAPIIFGTDSGEQMRITDAGRVGIGTNNPADELDINGDTYVSKNWGNIYGENLKIWGAGNSNIYLQPSGDSTGNVGIGTMSPDEKLVVDGAIKLTGGSDIAEPFDIKGKVSVEPGMIVAIDPENPGGLKISDNAYDRCVAGIVSGAGGIRPGLMLTQEDVFEGSHHVALAGRVYGLCDASYGSIEPGDLLTTSPTLGYAMKVRDFDNAQGAILGKAMTSLDEGQGLVLILVTLQ
ncbi:MAG: hypothetical protein ACFFBV_10690 [Promethearchaeota archaeon]